MSNKSKSSVDEAFNELESMIGTDRDIRKEMIDMLRKQIPKCEIYDGEKGMSIQAKMIVVKTLDDILKSNEDLTIKKIKMLMTRKDGETNGMVGETIVALLKNIRADGKDSETPAKRMDPAETMNKLAERVEQIKADGNEKETAAITVSDGELEQCDKIASDAARPEDEPEDDES